MWHEEMVNNRHKSVVRDMKWTSDGTKICIVYEDGAVIVGDVNGNRIWGKELEFQLSLLEWSPDNRFILFVSNDAKVYAYDAMGNRVKKLEVREDARRKDRRVGCSKKTRSVPALDCFTIALNCSAVLPTLPLSFLLTLHFLFYFFIHPHHFPAPISSPQLPVLERCQMDAKGKPIGAEVAAISWYDGAEGIADAHAPTLAIALTNGLVQLARSIDDANPVVIDTQVSS